MAGLVRPARASAATYDDAARAVWAPFDPAGGPHELVRYATLAANSHNSQPWKFRVEPRRITIAPDLGRRLPVVDPDDHHLYASLGCAAENLIQAAAAAGLRATPSVDGGAIAMALEPAPPVRSALFEAVPHRQSTRAAFDGKPVATDSLRLLERAGSGPGVSVILITDRARMDQVADCVAEGTTAQVRDKAFMAELESWIRFSEREAVTRMDGLAARATGNPEVPRWLARLLLPLVFTASGESTKYRRHIASSAGIAVFVSETSDKAHWIEAGRACQRFALQATALGIRQAFVNQPVEVPRLRGELAAFLGLGQRRPDLIVRFGTGPELPRSLRRPVAQVIA